MTKKTIDRPRRPRLLTVRMHKHEYRLLGELAKAEGLTSAEYVRTLIRREETLAKSRRRSA